MRLDQDSCYEISNISNLSHKTIFSHLTLIFTFADDSKDDVLAWAEVCAFSPLSGRPIAGQVFLNFKYFKEMDDEKYATHFETLIHEVHHILGLNPTVFPFFRIPES